MKKLIQISPASLFLGLSLVLFAGCATRRPPRHSGPPPRPVMPPAVKGTVRNLPAPIPVEVVEVTEVTVVEELPPAPVVLQPREGTSYTIRKGETLSAIAARNDMSWRELAEYNYMTDPNKIRVGQVILIPPTGNSAPMAPASSDKRATPPAAPANSGNTYVVQSGDSLSVISRRYNTSVREIKTLNGLNSDRLLVGQILKLPSGASASTVASSTTTTPAPRPTPVASQPLPTPTPLPSPMFVEETDVILIEEPVIEEDPIVSKAFPIVVQEGDTLESIANNYIVPVEDIRELNELSPTAEVSPGQKLLIPPSIY